ncbi:MAG: hypothetical protein U0U67_06120 [Chitinophagales bacterium]
MTIKYRWHQYNLNVICDKCQHPIPFQSFEGNPTCEECGTISDKTWLESVAFSNIEKVKQYQDGSTQLAGFMQLQMNYNFVENINCFYCHHALEIPENTALTTVTCQFCNKDISFAAFDNNTELKNLVFYFHKNVKSDPKGNSIAVRCASCGAPLEADATKNEYTCRFCTTLNIIPPSLRAKKVLDDVYVGWNGKL